MSVSAPAELLKPLVELEGARDALRPSDRLRALLRGARALRERLTDGAPVPYYRASPLVRVPYPTRYGLWRASRVRTPLLHILNRVFVVQVRTQAGLKTVLLSPSDAERNKETPYFKRLASRARLLGPLGERLLAPVLGSVEGALAAAGLRPEDVDYIAYDHLHTQDVRRWLGADGEPALLPNAKLLVARAEWEASHGLLPLQEQWYCPNGLRGLDPARVVLFDGDVLVGEGLAIVRTPGHTEGNVSFAVHTPEGLLVTSENGISADSYAPLRSRIPGLADHARATGAEVVLNGNTLEQGQEQYLSMLFERELAGPSRRDPGFWNVFPSSELAAYWAFPGVAPTFSFGDLVFGAAQRPGGA
jgi:hypothetical protein